MFEVWCRQWTGLLSAQGVSKLVASAPWHLDHRDGSVPPMAEVRAACGEPQDHQRQHWIRTTVDRKPVSTRGLEARRWRSSAPRPSEWEGLDIPAREGFDHRMDGSPPLVEVRAACGEPRDRLQQSWN
ncbi:hypothetical protein GOPIP_031_02050 [Gordonia polyisoprenivorans NBRC 16320 = JCM 10675]|nr:hypothetical protein GOPIP_031_02050 [Gordonia polyisoprenivorans NBRC 16320 = JCM 10675]